MPLALLAYRVSMKTVLLLAKDKGKRRGGMLGGSERERKVRAGILNVDA